jgi:hypothetical protein
MLAAAATSVPKLKIIYFAVRARAEPARLILEYGGIPYEDERCALFECVSVKDDNICKTPHTVSPARARSPSLRSSPHATAPLHVCARLC